MTSSQSAAGLLNESLRRKLNRSLPKFRGLQAEHYDERIRRVVPAYDELHRLAAARLAACADGPARILVAGAGTGAELAAIGNLEKKWRFTAFDPAADMLAIARRKVLAAGIGKRVRFVTGPMEACAYEKKHDAALSILVSHFFPDDGTKASYFRAIGEALKPGGLLVAADLFTGPVDFFDEWIRWLEHTGISPEEIELAGKRMRTEFHPVPLGRMEEILRDSGFSRTQTFFQTLGFRGITATRKPLDSDRTR